MARVVRVLVLALFAGLVLIVIPFGIRARFQGFSVPSESMAPTLLPGDFILVDKAVRRPGRGDLIVFVDTQDETQLLVKRVVGLGGEALTIDHGVVYIGCQPPACPPLIEPWADARARNRADRRFGPYPIPAGAYFVLADNRTAGEDSRTWGAVLWEQILGRPLLVYWSRDPDTGAIRWERLGLRLG